MTTYWLSRSHDLAPVDSGQVHGGSPRNTGGSWSDLINNKDSKRNGHRKSPVQVKVRGGTDHSVTGNPHHTSNGTLTGYDGSHIKCPFKQNGIIGPDEITPV
ncbi:hypothetical protein EGW08_019099 [Elysia chlorotica]|uniref:Uncharacterized protein n=1 Tax=Elysia chlorotica TaxID=188477 RepID=A0A3S0ZEH2_ELYCH|nr:hypothetical protein EGW08_019099 [Elysia chlorotica]